MMRITELFDICANRQDYTTIKTENGKYEVDYKFVEDIAKRTLYIFFEPSDGRIDWRVNFAYWRKPYKDMEINYRVHGGFLESWKLIDDAIGAKIREIDEQETTKEGFWNWKWKKIVIAGYSHGGALAALCHEYVWFNRGDLRQTEGALTGISFDGPRVFGGLWIPKKLKERWRDFYVLRNYNDIVTHLPPVLFFFRHVGNKVKMNEYYPKPNLVKAHYPEEIKKSLIGLEARTSVNWIQGLARLFKK